MRLIFWCLMAVCVIALAAAGQDFNGDSTPFSGHSGGPFSGRFGGGHGRPATSFPSVPTPPDYEVHAGEVYWLPDSTYAPEYRGYIRSEQDIQLWTTGWDWWETAPGVYDWTSMQTRLDSELAQGRTLVVQLMGTQVTRVPDFYLSSLDTLTLNGQGMGVEAINAWNPTAEAAYNAMVEDFGANFADHPALEAVYLPAISNAWGEEFVLSASDLAMIEAEYSLTSAEFADTLDTWLRGRMGSFATGFAGFEYKVAWVGTSREGDQWPWTDEVYQTMVDGLVSYAWAQGFGNRSGIVEAFSNHCETASLGQSISANGYILTDETIPPIAEGRYFGNENEEYGDDATYRYGSRAGDAHRFRFATLRELQMLHNHSWTDSDAEPINPPLLAYAGLSMGQTVETTPDVWCYLRETPVSSSLTAAEALKNIERWLIQRDVRGGETVPAMWTRRYFDAGWDAGNGTDDYGDYAARRTNIASDDSCIYFQADEDFNLDQELRIYVEVLDDSFTSWRIKYADSDSVTQYTDSYAGLGDGKIRTVMFEIDAIKARALSSSQDFCIVLDEGYPDMTARWVRVVHKQPYDGLDRDGPIATADSSVYDSDNSRAWAAFSFDEDAYAYSDVRVNYDGTWADTMTTYPDTLVQSLTRHHSHSTEGDTVYVRAWGVDAASNTGNPVVAKVAVPVSDPAPSAPTGLAATAGDDEVDLDWDDNSESDLASYNVYRGTVSGTRTLYDEDIATSAYTDNSVTNDSTYYYSVAAVDDADQVSSQSSEVSATPEAPAASDGFVGTRAAWADEGSYNGYNFTHYSTFSADSSGNVQYMYWRMDNSSLSEEMTLACIWDSNGDLIASSPCGPTVVNSSLVRFDFSSAISITSGTSYSLGILSGDTGWDRSRTSSGSTFRGGSTTAAECPSAAEDPLTITNEYTDGQMTIWMSNHSGEDGS